MSSPVLAARSFQTDIKKRYQRWLRLCCDGSTDKSGALKSLACAVPRDVSMAMREEIKRVILAVTPAMSQQLYLTLLVFSELLSSALDGIDELEKKADRQAADKR